MHLTIFWRVIFAQLTLIALILGMSLYALCQLHHLAGLSTDLLDTDSKSIEAEKHLLKIFLSQRRMAEKYLVEYGNNEPIRFRKELYSHFVEGSSTFTNVLEKIAALVNTPQERALLDQIRELYTRYATGLSPAFTPKSSWNQEKNEISEKITTKMNELIRFREDMIARKTVAARDQAVSAASTMGWLSLGGIMAAILFAYVHARRISRPLKKLVQGLLRVGQGEFHGVLDVRAPKEVGELVQTFNWMATRLEELDQMKADFIAHISHELRTPLTVLQGAVPLIQGCRDAPNGGSPEKMAMVERLIRPNVQRLTGVVNAILDVVDLENGKLELAVEPVNLNKLIEERVAQLKEFGDRRKMSWRLELTPDLPPVEGDLQRLRQVFFGLIENAVKFADPETTIRIRSEHVDDKAMVWIINRGERIAPEQREHLFEKFHQLDLDTTRKVGGCGLGLFLGRSLARLHDGEIRIVDGEEGETVFQVTLPLVAA